LTKIYHMVKAFVVVTFVLGGKFKLKDEPPRLVFFALPLIVLFVNRIIITWGHVILW